MLARSSKSNLLFFHKRQIRRIYKLGKFNASLQTKNYRNSLEKDLPQIQNLFKASQKLWNCLFCQVTDVILHLKQNTLVFEEARAQRWLLCLSLRSDIKRSLYWFVWRKNTLLRRTRPNCAIL